MEEFPQMVVVVVTEEQVPAAISALMVVANWKNRLQREPTFIQFVSYYYYNQTIAEG
jgi:hypothetical protein